MHYIVFKYWGQFKNCKTELKMKIVLLNQHVQTLIKLAQQFMSQQQQNLDRKIESLTHISIFTSFTDFSKMKNMTDGLLIFFSETSVNLRKLPTTSWQTSALSHGRTDSSVADD